MKKSHTELAELLFPDVKELPGDIYRMYPQRKLQAGAMVTRFAPSPTGFPTIGSLYATFISEKLAHQSGGIFYLRIEDTDKKREVKGSIGDIIRSLNYLELQLDEGVTGSDDRELGEYGPYKQSSRAAIYKVFIKDLIRRGMAYPCFCDETDLQQIRHNQQALNVNTGYYGEWARHRTFSIEQIEAELSKHKPFVIRFKSPGSADRRIAYQDLIKGDIEMPENKQDLVIMKSDGIPTYHFAHAVDDYLMGTTHVVRGDEWLSSVPVHLQLFDALGFKRPEYGHLAPLMKMEGSSKRKFSKRKDPDAAVRYYEQQGYPGPAVAEYFMTLINSDYEEWRTSHPSEPHTNFKIDIGRMSVSGALFDRGKLNDISKDVIARFNAEQVYAYACAWANTFDEQLYVGLTADPAYALSMLQIGRNADKPRKDIAKWSDLKPLYAYFFDDIFDDSIQSGFDAPAAVVYAGQDAKRIISRYMEIYRFPDDKDAWFGKIKELAEALGFAKEMKQYKQSPQQYKGHVGDIAMMIRVALTNRTNTPDLFDIMQVMGENRVRRRLNAFASMGWE